LLYLGINKQGEMMPKKLGLIKKRLLSLIN